MEFDFLYCIKIVLQHEGIYSNDTNDAGGETKYGISSRAFPDLSIKDLTESEAIDIYEEHYWKKLYIQHLPKPVRLMVLDCAVNQGPLRAAMFLQKTVGAVADGVIGDKTIIKCKEKSTNEIVKGIARHRLESYQSNPKYHLYGKGWTKRLFDILFRCIV